MLARRVILCLCFSHGVLVRSKNFNGGDYRYTQAFSWSGDADELMLIDITRGGPWPGFPDFLASYTYQKGVDIPVTAGGNVRSVEYARKLLNSGADKVVIGYGGKEIYREVSESFGAQALVAGIDVGELGTSAGCSSMAGRHVCGKDSFQGAARDAEALGAGEILLTSIDRDGSLSGYDLPTLRQAVECVSVPIVVAGGCGGWPAMKAAFDAGAQGAATTVIHHLAPSAMRACKTWLAANYDGPVRPAEAA